METFAFFYQDDYEYANKLIVSGNLNGESINAPAPYKEVSGPESVASQYMAGG